MYVMPTPQTIPRVVYGKWLHRVFLRTSNTKRAAFRKLYKLVLETYAAGMTLKCADQYFSDNGVSKADIAAVRDIRRKVRNSYHAAAARAAYNRDV